MRVREFRGGARSLAAIRRELLSADYTLGRHSRRIERRTAFTVFRRSYIEIIVMNREQSFLLLGRVLHTSGGFLPPRMRAGPPRRFTISNYNDYAHLLRDQLSIPLWLSS